MERQDGPEAARQRRVALGRATARRAAGRTARGPAGRRRTRRPVGDEPAARGRVPQRAAAMPGGAERRRRRRSNRASWRAVRSGSSGRLEVGPHPGEDDPRGVVDGPSRRDDMPSRSKPPRPRPVSTSSSSRRGASIARRRVGREQLVEERRVAGRDGDPRPGDLGRPARAAPGTSPGSVPRSRPPRSASASSSVATHSPSTPASTSARVDGDRAVAVGVGLHDRADRPTARSGGRPQRRRGSATSATRSISSHAVRGNGGSPAAARRSSIGCPHAVAGFRRVGLRRRRGRRRLRRRGPRTRAARRTGAAPPRRPVASARAPPRRAGPRRAARHHRTARARLSPARPWR